MMDIIDHMDHINKALGIYDFIFGSMDFGTAQKDTFPYALPAGYKWTVFPSITAWQYTHPLPYEEGISKNIITIF